MAQHSHLYRSEGIILRRHDIGETDRLLTLFTPNYGKLRVVAKGARKPGGRKTGYSDLFMRVDLVIRRGHSIDVIDQAEVIEAYLPLRESLERTGYAAHFAELVDAFSEEGDENRTLYSLLVHGLGWLCSADDLRIPSRYFELYLLDLVGFRPELQECVLSGEELRAENQFFSAMEGGVVSVEAAKGRGGLRPLSLAALKVLRHMQRESYQHIETLRLSEGTQQEVEQLLHETLAYHLERRLKSAAFLRWLRRDEQRRAREADQDQPTPGESS